MTTPGPGARASALLAESGSCTMTRGLTDAELQAVEARFDFTFNDDHREFLAAGLPVGPSWPDWRNGDEAELRSYLAVPVRHILRAVSSTPAHYFVPGLLQWSGAVNYGVHGVEHAAVLRRWSRRWGAELVALDDETATLRTSSPPPFGAEALEAAVEAYLYCPDSIDVHPDGVDLLAAFLIRPMWTFWWD